MPKQIFEVGDDRKLRRALGTSQDFGRDDYDTYFLSGVGHEYGALGVGQQGQTFSFVEFPINVDNDMFGQMAIPTYWAKGKISVNVWCSATNSLAQTSVVRFKMRKHYEDNVTGELSSDVIASATDTVTFPAWSNSLKKVTFLEASGWPSDLYDHDWLSWRVGREGTSGSDTLAIPLDIYGVTIGWAPHVSTA